MPAQKLRRRVADDVSAPLERPTEIRRRQGVVDDQRNARLMRDRCDPLEIDDDAAGVGEVLQKDSLGPWAQRLAEILGVGRVNEMALPAELFERQPELCQRSAVEIA